MIWHPDWAGVLSGQPLSWIGAGFVTTLLVTLVGSLLATVMLLLLALRMMPGRSGRLLVTGWVLLFCNTPLLVQLFFLVFCRLERAAGRIARLFVRRPLLGDTAR